ncbi:hypothetical protein Mithridates_00047 [Acinetobacter phage Mithridates]|nr:hypothetical protein Mithridates_00047 [Acinetobacter phage Mithridates]
MSEFKEYKTGEKIVYHSLPYNRLFYIKAVLNDSIVVRECWDEEGAKCFSEFPPYADIRHATPEEIAAGHRIDMPTLPKPIGSLQELHPEFAKVLNDNFLELISDDSNTENRIGYIDKPSNSRELETLDKLENHISPNCKVEDV